MRHSRSGLAAFQATAMVVALGVADKSVAQGDYEQVEHARRRAEEQQRIHANFSELLRRARDGKYRLAQPRRERPWRTWQLCGRWRSVFRWGRREEVSGDLVRH